MLRALAGSLLAAAAIGVAPSLVTAQAQTPAAPPAPPVASGTPLPEIGRTRATSAACAAMRDLVIPAFAAAQRADARFAETRKRLPKYGQIAADPWDKNSIVRESELSKLSVDAANMLQSAQAIEKLLRDPRLSADVKDPAVAAERAQLQQLYAAQQTRAAILSEFVQRESMSLSRNLVGMEDSGGLKGRNAEMSRSADPPPPTRPLPATSAAPGMPLLNEDFPTLNKAQLDDWAIAAAQFVRDKENAAAKTFLPLAQGCR